MRAGYEINYEHHAKNGMFIISKNLFLMLIKRFFKIFKRLKSNLTN